MSRAPEPKRWANPDAISAEDLAYALPSGLARYASKGKWRTAPHLNMLTKKLVDLEQRRIKRLIVEMPPRHGKSELCSHFFPAWYLGRNPDHQVILASYSSGFADQWGEKARDVLIDYGMDVFGVTVHPQRRSAGNWQVGGHTGRMRCAGVQSKGVTGRGAHCLIIDDPIADAGEASSLPYRERAWNWYAATARSRLEPNAIVIVIMTRWHMDDICGRLRKQEELGGEKWESITLPALATTEDDPLGRDVGGALWPWRYDEPELAAIKSTIPEHWWNALYMQRPTPPGGSIAKEVWFPIVDALPDQKRVRKVRFWDCGGGTGGQGDPTVGALVSRDGDTFYIEDIIRVFYTSGEVDKLIQHTAALDGRDVEIREEQEGGSAGFAIIASRTSRLAGYDYRGRPNHRAKDVNWMPMLIQAEAGNVKVKRGKWNTHWFAELVAAPHGEHDDQLDAVSGAFNELTMKNPPRMVPLRMG